MTPHALTRWLQRLMEHHGIVTPSGAALTTFHGLRRTGATLAIAAGVSPIFVQKQLGHTSFAMTERSYVVLDHTDFHHEFAAAFTASPEPTDTLRASEVDLALDLAPPQAPLRLVADGSNPR